MTLIEVLAALTLLGTTAAGMVVAHGRALHQLNETRRRCSAHALAGALLIEWRLQHEPLDRDANGTFDTHLLSLANVHDGSDDAWSWTRTVRRVRPTPRTEMNEIRLDVYRQNAVNRRESMAELTWLAAIARAQEDS